MTNEQILLAVENALRSLVVDRVSPSGEAICFCSSKMTVYLPSVEENGVKIHQGVLLE